MSRQPPLPPGPPPRSQSQYMDSRDRDRDRDRYNGSDSYRPSHPPPSRGYHAPERRDMYEFSGSSHNKSSNGYAAGTYSRVPPPAQSKYAPNSDTYRPQDSNFNFRFEAPSSINPRQYDDRRDRDRDYRPRSPPRQRGYTQDNQNSYRHNGTQNRGSRGGYRGRAGPRLASDRAFLKTNRDPTPELMPGMDEDNNHTKFKALDGLSDSEDDEMDISDDENASDSEQPRKKLARTGQKAADGDSVPKWSNPDPYTALPPPDESLRKKKDVVKLIRKARVEGGSTAKTDAAVEDFISFDFGGDEDDDEDDQSEVGHSGVPGAPTGPRYSHRDNIQKVDSQVLPPQLKSTLPVVSGKRPVSPIDLTSDPALGNRKRTFNDEIKAPPLIHKQNTGRKNPPASGRILSEWRALSEASATPWIKLDHSSTANMGVWLHKEIIDFYHHVKPREFEQTIRTKVVEDLRTKVKENFYGAEIQCFGSFMAGLYLPTADMDLVCLSKAFLQGRSGQLSDKAALYKFKAFLDRSKLVVPGSVELIPNAKVPLVKYVDRVTGLKIDISFENDTGVIANKTFQDWKVEFPAMPILVTVIKHFLAMRGLNEPVNGGIGGFSVTCLVVSLLQHMPQVQSRNMVPEHHLGEILMEFFALYGNHFNVQTTAIQTNPPALIRKETNRGPVYRNANQLKFSIIDPNRSSNDIAGGSSNAAVIIKEFSKAHDQLQARMGQLQHAKDRQHQSILGSILAGNYTTFDLQREHLAHIHEHLIGPIDNRTIV